MAVGWFWASIVTIVIGLVVGGLFSRALVGCGAFTEKAGRMLFAFVMLFVACVIGLAWLFTSVLDPSRDVFVLMGIALVFSLGAAAFGIALGKFNKRDKERIAEQRASDPSLAPTPEGQDGLKSSQDRWNKVFRVMVALAIFYRLVRILGRTLG